MRYGDHIACPAGPWAMVSPAVLLLTGPHDLPTRNGSLPSVSIPPLARHNTQYAVIVFSAEPTPMQWEIFAYLQLKANRTVLLDRFDLPLTRSFRPKFTGVGLTGPRTVRLR